MNSLGTEDELYLADRTFKDVGKPTVMTISLKTQLAQVVFWNKISSSSKY